MMKEMMTPATDTPTDAFATVLAVPGSDTAISLATTVHTLSAYYRSAGIPVPAGLLVRVG